MKRLSADLEAKKTALKADEKRVADARKNCRSIAAAAAGANDLHAFKSLVSSFL